MWIVVYSGISADNAKDQKTSSGQIVFTSGRDNNGDNNRELYAIDVDTQKQTRLTNDPAFDGFADFSPDGSRIAFDSTRTGHRQIYIMNADGTSPSPLTIVMEMSSYPAFGDGGKRIVFESKRINNQFRIYTMNADGSDQKPVGDAEGDSPELSSDGRHIIFSKSEGSRGRSNGVYIMDVDGTNLRRLALGLGPSFSPDGRKIVYMDATGLSAMIHTMNADGTEQKRLSPAGASEADPEFSPDGSQIVFVASPFQRSARGAIFAVRENLYGSEFYVMNADGSRPTRLTQGMSGGASPTWGPTFGKTFVPVPLPLLPPLRLEPVDTIPITPVQLVPDSPFKGELVAAVNDLQSSPYPSYLIARNLYDQNQKKQIRIQGLEGKAGDLVFDPQFSPDGKTVLVKVGDPQSRLRNPFDFHYLYLWERATDAWTPVTPQKLFVRWSSWSPDGEYIAYITGDKGQDESGFTEDEPLRLVVYNRRTKQEKVIVQNDDAYFGLAWAAPHTLLYSVVDEKGPDKAAATEQKTATVARPNTYALSPENGEKKLLIKDGQQPSVSPDGQWIAFFGSEHPEKPFPLNDDWPLRPGGAALSVMRRDGTGRKALDMQGGPYPFVIWRADNRHLLTLRQTQPGPDAQAEVKEWDIETGKWRLIGTLKAKDFEKIERPTMKPQFEPVDLSRNGDFLFVRVAERPKPPADKAPATETSSLQAMNLQSGEVTTMARLENAAGFDWHEEISDEKAGAASQAP